MTEINGLPGVSVTGPEQATVTRVLSPTDKYIRWVQVTSKVLLDECAGLKQDQERLMKMIESAADSAIQRASGFEAMHESSRIFNEQIRGQMKDLADRIKLMVGAPNGPSETEKA